MARDLKLNVDGDSGGGQRALEAAAAAADLAAREADKLGRQFKQAQRDAAGLDKQLAVTAVEMRALAAEFAKGRDTGIKKQLDAQKKAAAELKALRRDVIGDTEKAAASASAFAKTAAAALKDVEKAAGGAERQITNLGEGFKGLSSLTEALPAVGAGAAIPGLALLGGALGAGAGVGAVGAGVAGAVAGDPARFTYEWSKAIGQVKDEWISASQPFTEPTLAAIRSVGPLVAGWHLDTTLAKAAAYERPLVAGITAFVSGVEHGVAQLIEHAGPEVQALSQGLGRLGDAADSAFTDIAAGAHGGAQALHDTITGVSLLVEAFGKVTLAAEDAYGYIHDHPFQAAVATGGLSIGASIWSNLFGDGDMTSKLTDVSAAAQTASGAFNNVAGSLRGVAANATGAAAGLDIATKAFSDALGQALDLNEANAAVTLGLKAVKEGFESGAGALDTANVKGAQNVQLLDEQIRRLQEKRDADIAAGGATADAYAKADQAYNSAIADLQRTIAHLGAGSKAAADFFSQFYDRNIQIEIDVIEKHRTTYSNGVLFGSAEGAEEHRYGNKAARGMIRHMAGGGAILPASNPGTLIVGEPPTGGELWFPLAGLGQGRAQSLLQGPAAGYGLDVMPRGTPRIPPDLFRSSGANASGGMRVELAVTGSDALASLLMKLIRTGDIQIKTSSLINDTGWSS